MLKYQVNPGVQLIPSEDDLNIYICHVNYKKNKRIYQFGENINKIIHFCHEPKTIDEIKSFSLSQNLLQQDQFDNFFTHFLLEKQIITPKDDNVPTISVSKSVLNLKIALLNPSTSNFLSKPLIFLFNKNFAIFILFIFVLSIFDVFYQIYTGDYLDNTAQLTLKDSFYVLLLITAGLIFHELGHAAAAYLYGCRRVEIGIGWYIYFIVFYAELSEAWKLSHNKRVIIDVAGGYFQSIFGIILWAAFLISDEFIFLKAAALLALYSAFNLNPFLRMDGYWVFSDYFQIKNLRSKALDFIHKSFVSPRYFAKQVIQAKADKAVRVITIYSTLMFIFFVFFGYWIYTHMLPNSLSILENKLGTSTFEQFGTDQFAFSLIQIVMNSLIIYFIFIYTYQNLKKVFRYAKLKIQAR